MSLLAVILMNLSATQPYETTELQINPTISQRNETL
jgi:hypothetical protein